MTTDQQLVVSASPVSPERLMQMIQGAQVTGIEQARR
jgi:hypothetical protein